MEEIKYGVMNHSKIFDTESDSIEYAHLLGLPCSSVFWIIPQGMTQKMIDRVKGQK